jgi:hypothetical protein
MLAAAWQHFARYSSMAQAVAELLSPEAVTRTHQAAHQTIGVLTVTVRDLFTGAGPG